VQLSGQGEHGEAGPSILLVHPLAETREAIARAVAGVPGVSVIHAGDLAQATAAAARVRIMAIVLALDLADSRGLATLEALRATDRAAPVAVIVKDPALGRLAMRNGASAFIAADRAPVEQLARQVRDAVVQLKAQALEQDLARQLRERSRRVLPPQGSLRAIAHDFNNLLQIIINAAEELREGQLPTPHAQTADAILDAARRGIVLAGQLHALAGEPGD
jgi:DNA-binding NtrC family response regulator